MKVSSTCTYNLVSFFYKFCTCTYNLVSFLGGGKALVQAGHVSPRQFLHMRVGG
jgi:hypothetical protein